MRIGSLNLAKWGDNYLLKDVDGCLIFKQSLLYSEVYQYLWYFKKNV